ncbi:hypothetical protein FOZG_16342 [Fusarium oxysporum Fo47]|uniref:Uncharacterized protein n=1 Tax=Fusarium oxysporum Fo47 TaxID=660027 RepID=W9JKM0_FUSOX|nr:hypothetical protein FOZG_16342 [Fusarium oxysporum Fo47]
MILALVVTVSNRPYAKKQKVPPRTSSSQTRSENRTDRRRPTSICNFILGTGLFTTPISNYPVSLSEVGIFSLVNYPELRVGSCRGAALPKMGQDQRRSGA